MEGERRLIAGADEGFVVEEGRREGTRSSSLCVWCGGCGLSARCFVPTTPSLFRSDGMRRTVPPPALWVGHEFPVDEEVATATDANSVRCTKVVDSRGEPRHRVCPQRRKSARTIGRVVCCCFQFQRNTLILNNRIPTRQ